MIFGMNYIGSKLKLSSWIHQTISSNVKNIKNKIFCDLFAGTGVVARAFKNTSLQVIANDLEPFSYALNLNYIGNSVPIEHTELFAMLNALEGVDGFITKHYTQKFTERNYFSIENGMKIDAIRQKIEEMRLKRDIDESTYNFALASLLESADKVANTASVYGAYLKHLKKSAKIPLKLAPSHFEPSKHSHLVFNKDANILIKEIEGDILYLDPPYNHREYGANYHILNTIALYDEFVPRGKTGLREYQKSNYCKRGAVLESFEMLIKDASFKWIFLSYNNEGIMSEEDIRTIMSRYGKYKVETISYQRFKADKDENRIHKSQSTTEYLHILEK